MTAGVCAAPATSGGTARVTIIELDARYWRVLRRFRLAALAEAPCAFVTSATLEQEQLAEYWKAQFDQDRRWVVARHRRRIVGIASLVPDPESPLDTRSALNRHYVESVWVVPTHRGSGVLRAMIEHLEDVARKEGATELRLWVLDTNPSAGVAYNHLEFQSMTGSAQDTKKRRIGPGSEESPFVTESLMHKKL